MSSIKRIKNVISGIVMILASIWIMIDKEDGYAFVIFILDITLLLYGIRMFLYYFTMARYMVGGLMTLYKSIIAIDFGLFIFSLNEMPHRITMLYLIGIMVFNGAVVLLSAVEAKKLESSAWKSKFIYGAGMIILSIACIFFWNSSQIITIFYCLGLIHSAIYNITNAFRKTAIIHIE